MMILLFLTLWILSVYVLCRKCRGTFTPGNAFRESQIARELLQVQVEVQNSVLRQIADDLQDHIGQLLSVAHVNLNILEDTKQIDENRDYIAQANEMISHSIINLRFIEEKIGGDFLKNFKLAENLSSELIRIRKAGSLSTELAISGKKYTLGYEKEIVLFRISQEIINKIKRHSNVTNILVHLRYNTDQFVMHLSDNGVDLDPKSNTDGTAEDFPGLAEVKRKAEVIGGRVVLRALAGEGSAIDVFLPVNNP